MFAMAIAFAATLALLFFVSLLSPTIERFISSRTGNGADERRPRALSDAQEDAEPEQNLPERERQKLQCSLLTLNRYHLQYGVITTLEA